MEFKESKYPRDKDRKFTDGKKQGLTKGENSVRISGVPAAEQAEAHELASQKYDYDKECREYHGKAGKRKERR